MDLHTVQHFCKCRVIMIYDLAVSQIQFRDLRHIIRVKFEIPDVHVLLHAVFVYGLRNHNHASLNIPSQSHLSGALSVFLSDLCQYRMGKNVVPALSRSMQRLENEIQVPLFIRRKNKIELNENGKLAVEYAKKNHVSDKRHDKRHSRL